MTEAKAATAPEELELRPATVDDVDALADIMYRSMSVDPQEPYRYPRREQYKQDNLRGKREHILVRVQAPDDRFVARVVTDRGLLGGATPPKPIAFDIWRFDRPSPPYELPPSYDDGDDVDSQHMEAIAGAISRATGTYFENRLGPDRLHMQLLATDPAFQGRGVGTHLCRWGMQLARERGLPVTAFASPQMGRRLYPYLGFETFGDVDVHVEGEEEKLSIAVMYFPVLFGPSYPVKEPESARERPGERAC